MSEVPPEVWWKPFKDGEMWIRTFTSPCALSSIALGIGSGAVMAFQKMRLKSKYLFLVI